jgi:hypothetical protein
MTTITTKAVLMGRTHRSYQGRGYNEYGQLTLKTQARYALPSTAREAVESLARLHGFNVTNPVRRGSQ